MNTLVYNRPALRPSRAFNSLFGELLRDTLPATQNPSTAFHPAADILENSEALAGVTAVQEENLVYMPADTYTNESIQTYTEFLDAFADALEAGN